MFAFMLGFTLVAALLKSFGLLPGLPWLVVLAPGVVVLLVGALLLGVRDGSEW